MIVIMYSIVVSSIIQLDYLRHPSEMPLNKRCQYE